MGAPYRVALVPGEPNRTTTPGVGFAWGGLKMPVVGGLGKGKVHAYM